MSSRWLPVCSYHFPSNVWKRIADIPLDIAYHSLVPYHDRVLLVGGYNGIKFSGHIYAFTLQDAQPFMAPVQWMQLPVTAKSTSNLSSTGTRQPPPSCGSAVVVAQDNLFCFAGYTATGHANDLYKLNLRSNEWSVVDIANAVRPVSRAYLQAVVSPDGYLIIFGGFVTRQAAHHGVSRWSTSVCVHSADQVV
jgi:N-acetylneuraminic acid mutarotase